MRRLILTFVAALASASLALNVAGVRQSEPEVRQLVRLAAQAADIPVPRPLPIDGVASGEPVVAAVPDVAIAPPPVEFTAPAPVRVAPPAKLQTPPKAAAVESGTWAVVIGINDYPGTQYDLSFADNDASDTVQALEQQGVSPDHIVSLRDGQVTPDVVKAAVGWLTNHAGPDAVAVFFYAGHVRKVGSSEAIVTSDGGSVTDRMLATWLKPLAARRAWITIAACYGGGFDEVLAPGRVLTAAADANNVAYESSAFGRSYLVEYMIREAMIENAASDTVQSAFNWARAQISQQYPGREPVQYDYGNGQLDLRPAGASSAGAPSPAPDQSTPAPDSTPAPAPDDSAPSDPGPDQGSPPPQHCSGLIRIC